MIRKTCCLRYVYSDAADSCCFIRGFSGNYRITDEKRVRRREREKYAEHDHQTGDFQEGSAAGD